MLLHLPHSITSLSYPSRFRFRSASGSQIHCYLPSQSSFILHFFIIGIFKHKKSRKNSVRNPYPPVTQPQELSILCQCYLSSLLLFVYVFVFSAGRLENFEQIPCHSPINSQYAYLNYMYTHLYCHYHFLPCEQLFFNIT